MAIYRRDGFACTVCGWRPTIGADHDPGYAIYAMRDGKMCGLQIDHVLPRSRGGSNHTRNLRTLCTRCNCSKSGRTDREWGRHG